MAAQFDRSEFVLRESPRPPKAAIHRARMAAVQGRDASKPEPEVLPSSTPPSFKVTALAGAGGAKLQRCGVLDVQSPRISGSVEKLTSAISESIQFGRPLLKRFLYNRDCTEYVV